MPPLHHHYSSILAELLSSPRTLKKSYRRKKAGTRGVIPTRRNSGNTNETFPAKSESLPAAAGDGRRRKLTTRIFATKSPRELLLIYFLAFGGARTKEFRYLDLLEITVIGKKYLECETVERKNRFPIT